MAEWWPFDRSRTEEWKRNLRMMLPIPWEEQVSDFSTKYSVSQELAMQLYDLDLVATFKGIFSGLQSMKPSFVASLILEFTNRLVREGVDESKLSADVLSEVLIEIDQGMIAKEAAIDILRMIGKGEAANVKEAITKLGLARMSDEELDLIIGGVLKRNKALIQDKGDRAFSVLMGEVMKLARGKVDGQKVSKLLKQALRESS